MDNWKDRIIEFGRKPAHQFLANTRNARVHPPRQREALRGSLETIGNIGVIIESTSGFLVDGHARVEEALSLNEDMELAYVLVDLEPHEEAQALASYDFITTLAIYERDILGSLLADVQTDDARVMANMSELAGMHDLIPLGDRLDSFIPDDDRYQENYGVIIICNNESEQQTVYNRMLSEGYEVKVVVT